MNNKTYKNIQEHQATAIAVIKNKNTNNIQQHPTTSNNVTDWDIFCGPQGVPWLVHSTAEAAWAGQTWEKSSRKDPADDVLLHADEL